MDKSRITDILLWLCDQGLTGLKEPELLAGFCEKCTEIGLPVARAMVLIDTLHPEFEGRVFRWDKVEEFNPIVEYGSSSEGEAQRNWQDSVFYHLLEVGADEMRIPLATDDLPPFNMIPALKEQGHVDFIAMVHRFTERGRVGEMDCVYSSWSTRSQDGFSDSDLAVLRLLMPTLALAIKSASCVRIIETLAEVYLGQDAGEQVIGGRIARGAAERIEAVIWFSDLYNYTSIAERARPEDIIPFLNDYAETVITAIEECGGSVLKLIGDGVLAIFTAEQRELACAAALDAEKLLRQRLVEQNRQREMEGGPVTDVYLGLHIGEVFYGNIGSRSRLDFTVVGPAVNEATRISALCRSVDRTLILSSEFVGACPQDRQRDLVSLGRFALKGVSRAKELFTLDRERP
ncbi:adenylate/guanylate cyclase domain-containing protein [Ferirhizobium litorale]